MFQSAFAELLKYQPVQILVLLLLILAVLKVWQKQSAQSDRLIELGLTVTNIRDNHLEHLAQDVSNLRDDVKDVREGVAEINRFLREK